MGFLKNVGNLIGDVAKAGAKLVVAPVNALTGYEYNPDMKTKVGQALEKAVDVTEDVHGAAFNTATLGLGKKVGLFDGERESKAGTAIGTAIGIGGLVAGAVVGLPAVAGGSGVLGGLSLTKVASGVGAVSKLVSGAKSSIPSVAAGTYETTQTVDQQQKDLLASSNFGFSPIVLVAVVVLLLLAASKRKRK